MFAFSENFLLSLSIPKHDHQLHLVAKLHVEAIRPPFLVWHRIFSVKMYSKALQAILLVNPNNKPMKSLQYLNAKLSQLFRRPYDSIKFSEQINYSDSIKWLISVNWFMYFQYLIYILSIDELSKNQLLKGHFFKLCSFLFKNL